MSSIRQFSYSRPCWLVPNTREAVIQVGQLFGKDYCRFDDVVVRLYKPTTTAADVNFPDCIVYTDQSICRTSFV